MRATNRFSGITALILPVVISCCGCYLPLSAELLSGFMLHPDSSCQQIAQELGLGELRPATTPADVGLSFTPITVTSTNGAKLAGWFIPAQFNGALENAPLGTVLMTHGTDGSIACAIPWGALAAQNRLHAVLFDYQGFGESEGTANVAGLLDDSEAVLNWVLSDASPARHKVHLLGVSLGTGPAFGLAALRDRPEIQSVMVDGVFDPQQQVDGAMASIGSLLPLAGQSAQTEFKWLYDMRASLGNVRVPVLMITAELDQITPKSGADIMRLLLPGPPSNSWVFKGMGHVQPFFLLPSNYTSLAVTFWRNPKVDSNPGAAITDSSIRVPVLRP